MMSALNLLAASLIPYAHLLGYRCTQCAGVCLFAGGNWFHHLGDADGDVAASAAILKNCWG